MVREELQVAYLLASFPLSALQQAEVQGWEMVLVQAWGNRWLLIYESATKTYFKSESGVFL